MLKNSNKRMQSDKPLATREISKGMRVSYGSRIAADSSSLSGSFLVS